MERHFTSGTRLLAQSLLMLVLLGLCGQGACSRFYLASASTGSYMNAEKGGTPMAVRTYFYQLTHLPPGLPSAACNQLVGKTPSALVDALAPDAPVVEKSIFPGFEESSEKTGLAGELSKETKWVVVVPAFFECRDDVARWAAFRMNRASGTDELAFQLQGYGIRLHSSMKDRACTNMDRQNCVRISR